MFEFYNPQRRGKGRPVPPDETIMQYLNRGFPAKDIARKLFVSAQHVRNVRNRNKPPEELEIREPEKALETKRGKLRTSNDRIYSMWQRGYNIEALADIWGTTISEIKSVIKSCLGPDASWQKKALDVEE